MISSLSDSQSAKCVTLSETTGFDSITIESIYLQTGSAKQTKSAIDWAGRMNVEPLRLLHHPEKYGLVLIDGEYIRT
jgi:hypothetical protein